MNRLIQKKSASACSRLFSVKRTRFALFTILFFYSSLGYAQRITLKENKVTIQQMFSEIRKQTGYTILWKPDQLNGNEKITANYNNESIETVIKKIIAGRGLTFIIEDKTIVIRKSTQQNNPLIDQQLVEISGYIHDAESKKAIVGATVRFEGYSIMAPTDSKGYFSMNSILGATNFSVTHLGYKTVLKAVSDFKNGSIIELKPINNMIDEVSVINTGYQIMRKKDMTGSQSTLTMDSILMPAFTSVDQMLQGRIPGVIVTNNSIRPGTNPSIQIRGTSTFLGNTDPLWVVDGIIQEDPIRVNSSSMMTQDLRNIIGNQISWLNPRDIETITVLKDASATAIYGSKASNGVIVVTTKRGDSNRTSINYSINSSIQGKPNYADFNVMNSQERILFSEEAFNAGVTYAYMPIEQLNSFEGLMLTYLNKKINEEEFIQRKKQLETLNTNWFDLLTRNSFSQNHTLSVTGGNNKINYNSSVSYLNNNGVELNSGAKNLSGRAALELKLHPKLKINVSLIGASGRNKGYGPGISPISYATKTSRALPAFEQNGELLFYRKRASYAYNSTLKDLGYNILNEIENSSSLAKNDRINTNLNMDWKILPNLSFQAVAGFTVNNLSSQSHRSEETFSVAEYYRGYDYNSVETNSPEFKAALLPFGGELFTENTRSESYNIQNKLVFGKIYNLRHRVNALLGFEIRSNRVTGFSNTVYGYLENRGQMAAKPTAPGDLVPIGANAPSGLGILNELYTGGWRAKSQLDNFMSGFATIAYTLDDKYVFNGSIRNDASNRFGQDISKRIDPTYSLGIAWHMADEKFIQNNANWITNATWRATYGVQGNVLTSLSPELILIQGGILNLYNQYVSSISKIPNPNLTWERTKNWNYGFDIQLFGKVNLTADYYIRLSNAIIQQSIPMENGFERTELNGGMIANRGLELSMNFTPIRNENFAWSMSLNGSKNWNEAKSLGLPVNRSSFIAGSTNKIIKQGYPIGGFWSFDFGGLDPETGFPTFNKLEENESYSDPSQFLVYSGTSLPFFTGGFSNSIRYKTFTLGADFAVLLGSNKRIKNPYEKFYNGLMPDPDVNYDKELNNRWKKTGDEAFTNVPGFFIGLTDRINLPDGSTESAYTMWANSNERVVDASFVRCRQLSLSWQAPANIVKQLHFKNLMVNIIANNLFVIANKRFNGFDPELQNSVMPRMYSFGINAGF